MDFQRKLTNIFLLSYLGLTLIDCLPQLSNAHRRLKLKIDPILDVTGLWQGEWPLFAPGVDRVNSRLSAEITLTDGKTLLWNSPEWQKLSWVDRFLQFRHAEYLDNLTARDNRAAQVEFLEYLARTLPDPQATVRSGRLVSNWATIQPPKPGSFIDFGKFPEYKGTTELVKLEFSE